MAILDMEESGESGNSKRQRYFECFFYNVLIGRHLEIQYIKRDAWRILMRLLQTQY